MLTAVRTLGYGRLAVTPRGAHVGGWERTHARQLISRDGDNTDLKANTGEDIVLCFFPPRVYPFYEGLINPLLYKDNKRLRDWKCVFAVCSPLGPPHFSLGCSLFFDPSKKNPEEWCLLGCYAVWLL
jgi:hypothetical protein